MKKVITLTAPMTASVYAIPYEEGELIKKNDDEILQLESMKVITGVLSPVDGQIEKFLVHEGQIVNQRDKLVIISYEELTNA